MKILSVIITIFGLLTISSCISNNKSSPLQAAKVYVANEADGSVSIIVLQDSVRTTNINLSDGSGNIFLPHNVQTAPDGKSVWVTAEDSNKINQLIVIEPHTGRIKERVPLGNDLHLAHVVLDHESKNAFVTAEETNEVIQVDAMTFQEVRKFDLGEGRSPHGLRYSQGKLYVANTEAKSMSVINVADGQITEIPLGGMAVQTAVTRDNKFVLVSLYDTKEVIKYDLKNGQITRIPLPVTAQGPIQLYATPDSKLLYVAGQGELLDRPVSNQVFVIDILNGKVLNTIIAGNKAHDIVVSKEGKTVFVTNSMDNTVSLIDVATQKVIRIIPVGKDPNGISYWFETGGMP